MQNTVEQYIDSLISESNGYLSDTDRNLLFKLALKEKFIKRKEEFDFQIDERLRLFSETENCPNCSASKSKLLQVCDSCGYVMPGAHTSSISVQALIDNMENNIQSIKSAPRPNLVNLFKEQYHILFPYLTIWFIAVSAVMSINYRVDYMVVFIGFFAFLSIISFIYKKAKDKQDFVPMIASFSANFEKTKLLAKRHFGNEPSVQNLLSSYEERINQVKRYKKTIRIQLFVIYGVVLFLTGYVLVALPWVSYAERNEEIDKIRAGHYKELNMKLMIESTKLLKPFLQKQMELKIISNKPKGFLSDKILIKTKTAKISYIQQNYVQYNNDFAGFQLVADSVLIEVKKKIPQTEKFDLELCAYDEGNNPVIFNTILSCTREDELKHLLEKGKGSCYLSFKSGVLPFDDLENREKSKLNIKIYDTAKTFALVSRAR